ncbi:MAG: M3 family oligoendopeptidase [Bacteroidetes bacterium]|nr:M3 family oligoendopeptidase [Bacteroidota bacterium]
MNHPDTVPIKLRRQLLPQQFKVETWEQLAPYFKELKERPVHAVDELEKWLLDLSEITAILSEERAWRYIRMTCDTANKKYREAYTFFCEEISPHIELYSDSFNKKLMDSPYRDQLDKEKYRIYLRDVQNDLELFRERNIPLYTQLDIEEQKYAAWSGEMTINFDGKELTLQQAVVHLKNNDRPKRERVYLLIHQRRMQDRERMDELFNGLIKLRQQIATNTGFDNFRDYMFKAMGRFDYTIQDCFGFHDVIRTEVVPLIAQMDEQRKRKLNLNSLRPWDLDVDPGQLEPLHPFNDAADLINKSIQCFYKVRPFYGQCLETMKDLGRLDLDSRKGKAPGGYNYSLNETGVPFIFMNAAGVHRDLVTMVHEGGHAIHAFLTNHLELNSFKDYPSEVAELASMSMELISMEHWDVFFNNVNDLKRARREQLEKVIRMLPWIAVVDKFQHWIYTNKDHTTEERTAAWESLLKDMSSSVVDWTGIEEYRAHSWKAQLHIFDSPFYYIEYGMAQLGAVAMWKNYKTNPEKALDGYEAALKLGYTRSIPEIYAAAGIKFDFSKQYVHELLEFVKQELKNYTE